MAPNPFLLAADDAPALIPLLREHPELASQQDEHGYSLIHAAASYNHPDLLRVLLSPIPSTSTSSASSSAGFGVPVDLRDEDSETALFVVETVEAAKILVEEFNLDIEMKNTDGQTAREKLEAENEFPEVVEYLKSQEEDGAVVVEGQDALVDTLPAPPDGMSINVGVVPAEELGGGDEPDPEFRRRIEELAARSDFDTATGQAELRRLVEDALGEGEDQSDGQASRRPRRD